MRGLFLLIIIFWFESFLIGSLLAIISFVSVISISSYTLLSSIASISFSLLRYLFSITWLFSFWCIILSWSNFRLLYCFSRILLCLLLLNYNNWHWICQKYLLLVCLLCFNLYGCLNWIIYCLYKILFNLLFLKFWLTLDSWLLFFFS